ncbi:MAG: hypothetical protein FJ271_05205 [Planctomycetes bacterium]|nr:hypothetical protein [Planctomycetota bacterium]
MRQLATCLFAATLGVQTPASAQNPPRVEFTRLVAHWDGYGEPGYLDFISDARPQIAQVGFYGAHFWSLAHTPEYKGYPAHFPVRGLAECGDGFTKLNGELHRRKARVVGHFNVMFLVGDPDGPKGPRGFFKFYRDLWDEKALGPRPVANPLDLLEKNADGTPIVNTTYQIGGMKEYWGCLSNPHWRAVLKAWVKAGIARGVDGFISNYFYRHNCLCTHCQKNFRQHLRDLGPKRLAALDIRDVDAVRFKEIVGWHDPKESTPLRREMLRFSQISIKQAYDDVFVKYGRSLKPDLILAQWNHLGDFNQINGDERCLLPKEMWGKDEDYTWYSTGGAAYYTDLKAGFLGEGTLQARYIRGAFDDKPFTLGKYESTRIRTAIAEMAANGGAAMGFYTNFRDLAARKEIVRYYNFLEKHDGLFHASRPYAEAVLLFPRESVYGGDVAAVAAFKKLGMQLLNKHVLFDVLPDDLATPARRAAYQSVFEHSKELPRLPDTLSRFEAPASVRVSAGRPKLRDDIVLHFVNYNRKEPKEPKSAGRGIVDENPIAADGVKVDLALPKGFQPGKVDFLVPEESTAVELKVEHTAGRLRFDVPRFLVYAVVRIEAR